MLKELDEKKGPIKGYIQTLGKIPFSVIMFTQEQIDIFAAMAKKANLCLYFDATGSLIHKIPNQEKRVLYYALVAAFKAVHSSSSRVANTEIPLAEFVTNDHTITSISYFLSYFIHKVGLVNNRIYKPNSVIVDFSWACLQSVIIACNQQNIVSYLNLCWNAVNKPDKSLKNVTVVHICAAHFMHFISGRVKKCFAKQKL